ncbi:unnamed protein product [Rhizophagus irregularis]|uniref:Actin-like ATPase domain-containing protein n=1 Tax=Rhizophagus irregularis TaxID=588596 RepID=A0A916EEE7_9GLOM|nr:unnamed protein product [Rhizophagus irregularis]
MSRKNLELIIFGKDIDQLGSEEENDELPISKKDNDQLNSEEDSDEEDSDGEDYNRLGSEENNDKVSSEENNSPEENNSLEENNNQLSPEESNIRVVVGLDFGTTYSGFAYCHVNEERNLCSNDIWHGETGDLSDEVKPKLPVDYKKAITDYLREIGEVIKDTIKTRWPLIDYFENILLVITVPAEFSDKSKAIMRVCAFNAGLIKEECSTNLQFTTEPEAAAVYCMENLEGQNLARAGTNFMIVDCGNDGNMKFVISSRVLKYTYGIIYHTKWKEGDPEHRKASGGYIEKFHCLARRGTKIDIDQEIETYCSPLYSYQRKLDNEIYYTKEYDGEYRNDPDMF